MMKRHKKAILSKVATAALAFGMVQGALAAGNDNVDDQELSGASEKIEEVTGAEITKASNEVFTNRSLEWDDPLIPMALIAGLGALYGAACLYQASRGVKGAWLRAAAGGAVVITLLNPEILEEERERVPTEVAIVVDKSGSQTLDGRLETTQIAYDQVVKQLGDIGSINIRTIEVDSTSSEGTELFDALENSLSDVPRERLGGVIILTDGQVHDIPENAESLSIEAPVHVLVSGHDQERDRRIVLEATPRFGLVDEEQVVRFKVLDEGVSDSNEQVLVTVSSEGQVLSSKLVTPGEIAEVKVNISHIGAHTIELSIDHVEGELTDINNRVVTSIKGIQEALNVLLVSGQPSVSTRMWREILKADADTQLVHFTIMKPADKMDYTPLKELSTIPFPAHEVFADKINDFDLIVLDNYKYRGLLAPMYFNNIANYVKNGGSLLVAAGHHYASKTSIHKTPLSTILPAIPNGNVIKQGYQPLISDLGNRHPVTRGLTGSNGDDLPDWGRWFKVVDTNAEDGHVVMTGAQDKPLLILDKEGEGRTAMLLSDQAWLWERGFDGGGPHAELAQRISHWLMKNPTMDEEALRVTEKDGELIIEQQTLADENEVVTVTTPSGEKITVVPEAAEPGLWRTTLPIEKGGLYSVEQEGPNATKSFVNVGPENPKEFSNTISTTEKLAPLVNSFGGKIERMGKKAGDVNTPKIKAFAIGDTDQSMSGDNWMGIRISDETILKGSDRKSAIPMGVGLAAMIALLAAAYCRESETKLFGKKKDKANAKKKDKSNEGTNKPPSP